MKDISIVLKAIKLAQVAVEEVGLVMSEDRDILPLLQKALVAEFQQWDLYYAYKDQLTGLSRDPIAEHFAEHADDESDHIQILQRFIVGMGAKPTVERAPIPNLEQSDTKQIVALQLKFELDAIKTYQQILQVLDDRASSALKIEIENILIKETEHAHDLQLLLRD